MHVEQRDERGGVEGAAVDGVTKIGKGRRGGGRWRGGEAGIRRRKPRLSSR